MFLIAGVSPSGEYMSPWSPFHAALARREPPGLLESPPDYAAIGGLERVLSRPVRDGRKKTSEIMLPGPCTFWPYIYRGHVVSPTTLRKPGPGWQTA